MRNTRKVSAAMALALGAMLAGRAEAAILLTAAETSGGVIITGGGTLNLTGLTLHASGGFTTAGINAAFPGVGVGRILPTQVDDYTGIAGPTSFGTGGFFNATSATGSVFGQGRDPGSNQLDVYVPVNYASGSALAGTATFAGATFASLGLVQGTYVFTLPQDTFTFQVGPAAVPEPASLAMLGLGLAGVGIVAGWRRRAGV